MGMVDSFLELPSKYLTKWGADKSFKTFREGKVDCIIIVANRVFIKKIHFQQCTYCKWLPTVSRRKSPSNKASARREREEHAFRAKFIQRQCTSKSRNLRKHADIPIHQIPENLTNNGHIPPEKTKGTASEWKRRDFPALWRRRNRGS